MELIYIYDALCGWCYGFSPVIQKLVDANKLEAKVISGGMITGNRIGPIGEVAPYISKAYKDVEERCGVTFGAAFLKDVLEEGSAVFTSIPAAIALCIVREELPGQQLSFAAAIQKAIYYHGKLPDDVETYTGIAMDFNMDTDDFAAKMKNPIYLEKAQADFQQASQMGVTGFPTVLLVENDQAVVITRGFVDYANLEQQFHQGVNVLRKQ